MKKEFNHLSGLMELDLSPHLKAMLWKTGLVRHAPVIDILLKNPAVHNSSEEQVFSYIEEIYDTVCMAEFHAPEYFPNQGGKLDGSILYSLLGYGVIGMNSENFLLEDELEFLNQAPERIHDPAISVAARFVYLIDKYKEVRKYLEAARSREPKEEFFSAYRKNIAPIKSLLLPQSELTEAILATTRMIDMVLNHHDQETAPHVKMGWNLGFDITDKSKLYTEYGLVNDTRVKHAFNLIYGSYENLYTEAGYDAFYAFSQQAVKPVLLAIDAMGDNLEPRDYIYLMARAVINDPNSGLTAECFGTDITEMQLFSQGLKVESDSIFRDFDHVRFLEKCRLVAEFENQVQMLWGDRVGPKLVGQDLIAFKQLLIDTENLNINNNYLASYWGRVREEAISRYNSCATITNSAMIEQYFPS